jgi:hypothetical protein
MKDLISLLVLTSGIISCGINDSNCDPEIIHSDLTQNKEILVAYNSEFERNEYNVIDAGNRLFEYTHTKAQCNDIMDDEWGEILTFEIPEDINEFDYTDENILQTKCFYRQFGAWVRHNQYEVKNGRISGVKMSDEEWEVSVSVTTTPLFTDEQPILVEFAERFKD